MSTPGSSSQEPSTPGSSTSQNASPGLAPPGTTPFVFKVKTSTKGVENAKKRLRAFSLIQKKTPLSPVALPKSAAVGNTTVLIGKLGGIKSTPKVTDAEKAEAEVKKPPKPPKPGTNKKYFQDSYSELQKRTLAEIEDMKRKMELVDLGIPLGLICPSVTSETGGLTKAMPTKAMPPIKSFLDPAKVDEIIKEAKKAKAEGREFKFDYQKLLPDYDNPFQRKKEEHFLDKEKKSEKAEYRDKREKDRRKSDKYDYKRYSESRKDDKYKHRDKHRDEKNKDKEERREESKKDVDKHSETEASVNLNDYLVCDSWSLDNDDKNNSSSPKIDLKIIPLPKDPIPLEISEEVKEIPKKIEETVAKDSPSNHTEQKMERLQPVMDSFKFEIDEPNDDEILDIFDEDSDLEKFSRPKRQARSKLFDFEQDQSKDASMDSMNDDNFLESVINEIKQEHMSDEDSQDKGLVEYDISPKDDDSFNISKDSGRSSATPELDDRMRDVHSRRSDYSDGYKSVESGYKSDSRRKSSERDFSFKSDSLRFSPERDLVDLEGKMSRITVDSLETWSFVLKICQPLLFRHDKNKCYRETRSTPKLWYTVNPKTCSCVKDRSVVYEELETCKSKLVDRLYGCDQVTESSPASVRRWYPTAANTLSESSAVPLATDWESEPGAPPPAAPPDRRRSLTPAPQSEAVLLDREYKRFMQAVWPEVTEPKPDTSRSTTPVREDAKKKKKEEELESDDRRKRMKMTPQMSSEGWSQESDVEEEPTPKKMRMDKEKVKKTRKRKLSASTISSSSESEEQSKKKKFVKKKDKYSSRNVKSKLAKRRRTEKKYLKKLKEKQKKKKKLLRSDKSEMESDEEDSKKKKARKKKQQKLKKLQKKRKNKTKSSSSDTSTDSSSDSESEVEKKTKRAKRKLELKKKKKDKKKKRKQSSDSSQSEELFDINILNNIKTERLTDEERKLTDQDFSPRRQQKKTQEIINVKELQNDFVGNNIHIKQEVVEEDTKSKEMNRLEKPYETESRAEVVEVSAKVSADVPEKNEPIFKEPHEVIPISQIKSLADQPSTAQIKSLADQSSTAQMKSLADQSSTVQIKSLADQSSIAQIKPPSDNSNVSQVKALVDQPAASQAKTLTDDSPNLKAVVDESNLSQSSSQESVCSVKDAPIYEKDESHLRPSSQNSNYSFNDVIASQTILYPKVSESEYKGIDVINPSYRKDIPLPDEPYHKIDFEGNEGNQYSKMVSSDLYDKEMEADCEDKFDYEHGNYEMYEQMAMQYQSDVFTETSGACAGGEQRIETVVRGRTRGEIKCDWRAGDTPAARHSQRPSRWGLKPGEVNIVLTGGNDPAPVYKIQSLANNRNDSVMGYDEAYMHTYGASDRLQYGDCFAPDAPRGPPAPPTPRGTSLDARIDHVLRDTVLGEVAKDVDPPEPETDAPEKGILVKSTSAERATKRVSFADGYKPGQDSDVEDPPVKKKKSRRMGCAWPCPASHPDHVPLWDALPPPPPPPGSPPPPPAPPPHALLPPTRRATSLLVPVHHALKSEQGIPMGFMPPEPPPGLITFH